MRPCFQKKNRPRWPARFDLPKPKCSTVFRGEQTQVVRYQESSFEDSELGDDLGGRRSPLILEPEYQSLKKRNLLQQRCFGQAEA